MWILSLKSERPHVFHFFLESRDSKRDPRNLSSVSSQKVAESSFSKKDAQQVR